MMRWFTSDQHLGGEVVATRWRKFPSVLAHDDTMAATWDSRVAEGDEVWILGDLIGQMSQQELGVWLAKRPGSKHLVLGNNDIGRDWEALPLESVVDSAQIDWPHDQVEMSHYPTHECGVSTTVLLHGHTHRKTRFTADPDRPALARLHVGWDAWRRPVAEPELQQLLAGLRGEVPR